MFVIGEARENVAYSKLKLPKEYNLNKKDRTIYGVWSGMWVLYLSDEITPLKSKTRKKGMISRQKIDSKSCIMLPSYLENKEAIIKGCISMIEIKFLK